MSIYRVARTFLSKIRKRCYYWIDIVRVRVSGLIFNKYVIRKVIEEYSFQFCITDLCAKQWYDDERISTPETAFIKENLLKRADIVADCGAHHGLVTLLAAKEIGADGHVFAFEALPRNVDTIKFNVRLNNFENVIVENLAVGESCSTVAFLDDSNGYVTADKNNGNSINVQMTSLDDYFMGKVHPTFLKIDVEGFEIHVLKGAQRILMDKPRFSIEFHTSSFKDPASELNKLFELINIKRYKIFIQLRIDEVIEQYDSNIHTPHFLCDYDNIHFFGIPKELTA